MGKGSSWQLAVTNMISCTVAIQRTAATGGWSRFDTKKSARAGMSTILKAFLIPPRKEGAKGERATVMRAYR